jgi:hypothetical protein
METRGKLMIIEHIVIVFFGFYEAASCLRMLC